MANFAVVDAAGVVINRIVIDGGDYSPPSGCAIIEETDAPYEIGGRFVDGLYEPLPVPDPMPAPVPQSISDRQFFQQLAVDGIITEEQALASNAAVIPLPLLTIINELPLNQQFDAKMKVSGATTFNRNDPLTIAIGQAYGMSPSEIDEFFTAAAAL